MAPHHALAGLPSVAPGEPRRAGRWRPALLLGLAVAGWHVWLVDRLAPTATTTSLSRPGLVQLRSLAPADVAAPVAAVALPSPVAPPGAPPAPARSPASPGSPAAPADPLAPGGPPAADRPRPVAPIPPVADRPVVAAAAASPAVDGNADRETDADTGAAGVPPPLYATQLPPPTQLRYALLYNGQAAEALLTWQHDGQRYQLSLHAQTAAGVPLLQQASAGLLDVNGLAPDRFTDRRRQGRTQAANFRRDIGRIGYSGPPQQHPAWPGAQDRLSWLAQLLAVLAAAGSAPPASVTLFVADARGQAGLWHLQRQPDELLVADGATWPVHRWLREPPRPEGLRIEAWLPADPAGPAGPWPLRLRLQVPRSGHLLELQRAAPS